MTRGPSLEQRALLLLEEALDRPPRERAAFVRAASDDAALVQRVLRLLSAEQAAAQAVRTGGAFARAPAEPPAQVGAYRITGLIGEGGMGCVYRAERARGDFTHTVAIKLIRQGALSDALIERFQRERQTLADLAHPNIARLFDGGTTEDGQPFIVMELIDGEPLTEWVAATDPSRETRLRLFLDICSAVGFAHQNLVIHRDLTPSNVLVTRAGVAKLIDFGIARPVADTAAASRGGSLGGLSLTPGFAAPERIAGGAPTTLTDIYSLGRLLGVMLEGDRDPDLAAIVALACDEEPAARYASVDALADDVRAFLAGQVVTARRGGRRYAVGKFVRRHRFGVAAGAAALALLVAALVATLVANARAQAARAHAEVRFAQTRALARTMMFDVHDAVAKVPGSTEARALLAGTAQRYLDSLAADPTAPADVRLDVGEGYARLARAVGYTGGGSLGQRAEGKALFERARKVLEALVAERPERQDARLALGHLLATMAGEALYGDNDATTARRHAIRARALLAPLAETGERAAGAFAGAYLYDGDAAGFDNDIPGAGVIYEQGIARVETLPAALRDTDAVRISHSGLLRQAGEVYRYTGQPAKAIARMEAAVALNRRLVAASRGAPPAVRRLISSLWSLGDMYRVAGRLDQALTTIREGQALARRAARADPADAGARESIALTAIVLAQVQSARDAHADGVAAADEAIGIRRDLAARSGGNTGSRLAVAVGLKDAAPVYRAAGQPARACAALRESADILGGYARAGTLSRYDRDENLAPVTTALKGCQANAG